MQKDPSKKISSVSAGSLARPALAEPRPHARAALVQRGFTRWQPGARRADERVAKTGIIPDAREDRLQGNRSRLPSASNTEFAFNRLLHRERPRAGRRVVAGARAGARGFDRTHHRVARRREEGDHSLYNSTSPAQRRVVFGKSKDEIKAIAVQGAQWIKDRLPKLNARK